VDRGNCGAQRRFNASPTSALTAYQSRSSAPRSTCSIRRSISASQAVSTLAPSRLAISARGNPSALFAGERKHRLQEGGEVAHAAHSKTFSVSVVKRSPGMPPGTWVHIWFDLTDEAP